MGKSKDRRSPIPPSAPNLLPPPTAAQAAGPQNWQITWPNGHKMLVHAALSTPASGDLILTDAHGVKLVVQAGSGAMAERIDPKPLAPEGGEAAQEPGE